MCTGVESAWGRVLGGSALTLLGCCLVVRVQMKMGVDDRHMAGMIAMTKVHATKTFDLCAREATQIMGGAACVRVCDAHRLNSTHCDTALSLRGRPRLVRPALSARSLIVLFFSLVGWLCVLFSLSVCACCLCVQGGPGEKVERLYREVRINAIGGGSEEILLDLVTRQAKL